MLFRSEKWATFADLTTGERLALAPAIALLFAFGLYPQILIALFNTTTMQLVNQLKF